MVNPTEINNKLNEFLEEFKNNVGSIDEIISISIDVKGKVRTLYSVKYTGSGNILEDPDVKEYLDEGGYIVGIEFVGNWRGCKFRFKIGYSNKFSYMRVSRGRNSLDLTKEALSKLKESYLRVYGTST